MPMTESTGLFEQAVAAARQKDLASARMLLKQLLKQEPDNLNAWLLGAHVVETREDQIRCYERVLRIDPNYAYARQKLSELKEDRLFLDATPGPASTGMTVSRLESIQPQVENSLQTPSINPSTPTPKKPNEITIALAGVLISVCCLAVIVIAFFSSGALSLAAQPTPSAPQLFNVLYQNAKASNTENMEGYMATIHPASPMYLTTQVALGLVFSEFDLSVQFYDLKVISLTKDEAKIHFSLLTRKINGGAFRDNVVIGTMTLKPDNGVWKIYGQDVENVEYK
jgi:hypothetical protein